MEFNIGDFVYFKDEYVTPDCEGDSWHGRLVKPEGYKVLALADKVGTYIKLENNNGELEWERAKYFVMAKASNYSHLPDYL